MESFLHNNFFRRILASGLGLVTMAMAGIAGATGPMVRIGLFSKYSLSRLTIQASAGQTTATAGHPELLFAWQSPQTLNIQNNHGKVRIQAEGFSGAAQAWKISPAENTTLTVQLGSGETRELRGVLWVQSRRGRLEFIQEVDLEDYVAGVLPAEMAEDFPLQALQAQAVLARTYAVAERPRHREDGYDFCDLTHCQAYRGQGAISEKMHHALDATHGWILRYQRKPIAALYHSTCGGHTAPNQKVFGGRALPYLQGVEDPYCSASPHSEWNSTLALDTLAGIVAKHLQKNIGTLEDLRPAARDPNGRLFTLALVGRHATKVPVMEFLSWVGQALGWNQLKSNWFESTPVGDSIQFKGRGLGHGVGLCQWGARGMAEAGKSFREILRFYFPKTRLERIP